MYEKLKKIQELLWKDGGDIIDQDTLYDVIELMGILTLEVAKKEKKTADLIKTFPWLYTTEKE